MKKLWCIAYLFLLFGCERGPAVFEVNIEHADNDVLQFVEMVGERNGDYLYIDDMEDLYVFLNRLYVPLGRDAMYIKDFHITAHQDALNIFFNQESDSDYEAHVKYQVLYKIASKGRYETIHLIENGKPTSFDRVFLVD